MGGIDKVGDTFERIVEAMFDGYNNGGCANLSESVDWSSLFWMNVYELIDGEDVEFSSEDFSFDWMSFGRE